MKKEDPRHYHYGIFYYNKDDERILVPKRIPFLGRTLNLARWESWVMLLCVALILIFNAFGAYN